MTMSSSFVKAKALAECKSREQIQAMFDEIAPVYDFLNRVLSFGLDWHWRKVALRMACRLLPPSRPLAMLDVATGTGDFAALSHTLPQVSVVGIDLSEEMLRRARRKVPAARFVRAAAEALPFDDASFDLVTVGFGARNFQDLGKGLLEIRRVLKPHGVAAFLEPMIPTRHTFRRIYLAYFKHILPQIARLFSTSDFAYQYLPLSVETFPQGEAFLEKLGRARFSSGLQYALTYETAILYIAQK
jgi:demethylmenaquinone methyltransferase/2-methoxy-6-polyprenyl-1,4-benzoquinol methylase